MKILEFQTLHDAQATLAQIEARGRPLYAAAGYTVDEDGKIVGRDPRTGKDKPNAQRTERWALVETSPDGTFWFPSTSEAYPKHHAYLVAGLEDLFTERDYPAEWDVEEGK